MRFYSFEIVIEKEAEDAGYSVDDFLRLR